jgi:hypothetical protein
VTLLKYQDQDQKNDCQLPSAAKTQPIIMTCLLLYFTDETRRATSCIAGLGKWPVLDIIDLSFAVTSLHEDEKKIMLWWGAERGRLQRFICTSLQLRSLSQSDLEGMFDRPLEQESDS